VTHFYHERLLFSNVFAGNSSTNKKNIFLFIKNNYLYFVAFLLQIPAYGIYATKCGRTAV